MVGHSAYYYRLVLHDVCIVCILQWVYMLENVHVVLGWCGLSSVDPGLSAEVALRLSLVLEAAAACKESAAGKYINYKSIIL